MITAQETKVRGSRRVIISGRESLASLLRLGAREEPGIQRAAKQLWKTQAILVSPEEASRMYSEGQVSPTLLKRWRGLNAGFVHSTLISKWSEIFTAIWSDMESRLRRVRRKSTASAIEAYAQEHGGALIKNLDDALLGAVRIALKVAISNQVSPYVFSQLLKSDIGLSDRLAAAVQARFNSLVASGMDIDAALAQAKAYAQYLQDYRAFTIARTELADALNEGQLDALQELGEQGIRKTWATADDERTCAECSEMDGEEVGINDSFSNGDDCPPAHPDCRCSVEYAMEP